MKILHLTLKKKWFDLIASGEKKEEYREIKPYWTTRLLSSEDNIFPSKKFDEIHFRNGYRKDAPFMRVQWEGMMLAKFEGKRCYAIQLGKVLEIRR